MGTFTKLNYHIVFATKNRLKSIRTDFRERLYEYIGGIIRAQKGSLIEIGGVADYIHILARIPPTIALSDSVRDLKASSSKWIHESDVAGRDFAWQKGFGAFTVSYSLVDSVVEYVRNQEEHHRVKTFQEEYIEFLKRHDIEFEPKYLFDGEHFG